MEEVENGALSMQKAPVEQIEDTEHEEKLSGK